MAVEFMETLNENTSANTGLSPITLFTLLATGVTVYYMVSIFFRGSSDHHQQHTPMSSEEEDVQSRSMASSSSSSSHSLKHEVFLSFRGEDTRKNFVDHLYMALVQQGIQTYKDDETLPRGERIGPALLKAIQESRIALVVFSQNYADSSWCLDELVHIMECMDTRGQIVEPVFYFVDPSDVRKQKGEYGKSFRKHERENKQKVESWRKALEKAGNLSGWVIDENSHEAKCIKEIVGTISSRLPTLSTNVNKDLIGIETRLQDLKSKLKMESGGVRIIGIWGVGGGGKTTLANAAYAEISHRFEAHCLLENIREKSRKKGLAKLQKKFLKRVLKTEGVKVGSEIEGRSMIKTRLHNKSVLVVLDDVDDLKQLKALAGSRAWFGKGSRIIITTRDEHLLTRHADEVYEVSLLSDDEAMELFNKHAYREDKPIEDYEMLSKDVVSYASGLPLALEILGSFLYDKNKDEWKSALAKLKCIPNVKVTERLKISYDGLEPDQQKLFLDIACFLRGWGIDNAMMVLDACNLHPRIGVKVLVQKSLIKVTKEGRFDMHDLVEEMAHYIVRGAHPNHPEKHSRIWKREDIAYLCDMGADAVPMETEVLTFRYFYGDPDLSDAVGLSDVVANMKKLRWINIDKYPASSFPSNFQPTGLGCLECVGLKSFPPIIQMQMLETLDLSYCSKLQQFPDIQSNMVSLVTLDLHHTGIEIIPPSVGRLPGLKFLDLSNCGNLVELPDLPSSIAILKANGCDSLEIVRDLSDYKWLWKVSLRGCYKLIGGETVLHSMLEGNAAKDRFMSALLPAVEPSPRIFTRLVTLQLPSNWDNDFSGLLLFLRGHIDIDDGFSHFIDIKQETSTYDYSEESEEDWEQCKYERVGYVPFNSLRHIPWLNPTYTKNILFQTNDGGLNVELVRSKNKIVDLNENPIDCSECWDEEYEKTFEILYDSQSFEIQIVWKH